ncbi:TlyA family RNA methyltransferase [Nitrosophilus alvini]|uniref:23S rRNA (cytidine-2'-O)-methyltransferase TlyA n=1 Tax=Nitrosophilus alvini TaxID=2714855 RepID=UPI00190989B2|nr:TlyA family RNA methyltransferase [Nitrosophilus alvini]
MRLDKYLCIRGLAQSRNKAIELIKDGRVKVGGKRVKKPSLEVSDNDIIDIDSYRQYVSRAALKLKGFLEEFPLDIEHKSCMDIGASTGGFTEILLENGAAEVYCIDVGSNQLSNNLKSNEKVKNFEKCDIRGFECDRVFDIITCDVSFISVINIIKDIDRFAKDKIIILFKPQFEVGREAKRDKAGVVIDEDAINAAMQRVEKAAEKLGWRLIGKNRSKLKGKEGNVEWFYLFEK